MNRSTQNTQLKLPNNGERGFVLALCLVLLLIMTILGVTALNTSVSQEGMARDIQQSIRAFQHAESGGVLAGKTLNEVLKRKHIVEADPTRADSIPTEFPKATLFANFKKEITLEHGDADYTVRRTGNIDGRTPSCRTELNDQSGGCSRFYNFNSTGKAQDLAKASISGAGCVFTQAQGVEVNAATGGKCN